MNASARLSSALLVCALFVAPACGDDDGADDDDDVVEQPDAAPEPTLYERLGEEAGIRAAMTSFVGRVVADPKINGYFLNASVDGGRLIECLTKQVGNATGGPQVYPDPPQTDNGCRDMATAHLGLGISTADFGDLVGHLIAELEARDVAQADIDTITSVLGPLAGDIVEDENNDQTVYQRVGRKPAIVAVIDGFVAAVAADVRINGFFGATDIDRLETCLVRQVCSIDGPCRYGQEIDDYEPGVSAAEPCRDMATTHAGLVGAMDNPIGIADFNALVEDLVGVLDGAGVSEGDKGALLGVLGSMCPMIVGDAEECN